MELLGCKLIIPFWHDSEHTELDAIIRIYDIEEYETGNTVKKIWEFIEYYTPEGLWKYKRLKAGGSMVFYQLQKVKVISQ